MNGTFYYIPNSSELVHHGVKGQKHGVRQYQNKDGTWTELGKERRRVGNPKYVKDNGELTKTGIDALQSARRKNKNLSDEDRKEFGLTSYQAKGGTIKKGDILYRITHDPDNDQTINKRKYFSTSPADNNAWAKMFGPQFKRMNESTYSLKYTPVKDLKVSSNAKLGEVFYNDVLKKGAKKIPMSELENADYDYGFKNTVNKPNVVTKYKYGTKKDGTFGIIAVDGAIYKENDKIKFDKSKMKTAKDRNETYGSIASTLIASQVATGKKVVNAMLKAGYDAIPDVNGTDIAYDPIIVLNPDKKLTKTSITKLNPPSQTSWPMKDPQYSDLDIQDHKIAQQTKKKKWWPF